MSPTAAPSPGGGLAITGTVHGGQQAIVGAHVYLLAVGTGGNGGPGIAPSFSNQSTSLLTTGTSDSIGGYVTTGAGGTFSITGDYICPTNAQVYLYALGGNSGFGGNNPAAGLIAALGSCSSLGPGTFVTINEVSTVAAAYALAGYASDATHISSSGSALANTGVQNAFANVANLENVATGAALATTPAGNGTVPQAEINTLANILASCVNSTGAVTGSPSPTACYVLFLSAESAGLSGTMPSDTATAAINIAHNPGTNVGTLFNLATGTAPFAPTLSITPNDFTVGVAFTGGGLQDPYAVAVDAAGNIWTTNDGNTSVSEFSSVGSPLSSSSGFTGGGLGTPNGIAVDTLGNIWVANSSNSSNSVTEFSSSGFVLSGTSGYTGGGMNGPYGLAIDASNAVWVSNSNTTTVTKLSSAGAPLSGANGYSVGLVLAAPHAIAIDANGNAWVADKGTSTVTALTNSGTPILGSPFSAGGISVPYSIAVDHGGNIWVANYGNLGTDSVSELSSNGSPAVGSPFTGGGISLPESITVDGAGNIWVANSGANAVGTVSELTNNGTVVTPTNGYILENGGDTGVDGIAIDGSGDVWVSNLATAVGTSDLVELIGAATPVVTPLVTGISNNTLGTRP